MEAGERTDGEGHGLDIQDHDRYAPLIEQLDHMASDASGTASYQHNLSSPIILVVDPIISSFFRSPIAGPADEGDAEERPEMSGGGMEFGEVLARLCEASEQHKWEQEGRV